MNTFGLDNCVGILIKNKFIFLSFLISIFWYLALFPGRLGADTAGAIRLIKAGETTDVWTALYFKFLRFTTFEGRSVALTSIIQLTILALTIYWCMIALPITRKNLEISYIIFILTPFFGAFGMTIAHDNLQVSGLMLLLGIEIRIIQNIELSWKTILTVYGSSICLLLTTHTGVYIALISLLILAARKRIFESIMLMFLILIVSTTSLIGVTTSLYNGVSVIPTSQIKYWSFIADLKCVTQHPQADISIKDWKTLEKISTAKKWKDPISCESSDKAVNSLDLQNSTFNFQSVEFLKTYMGLTARNSAIVVMAHIQRGRGLLPPPFFQAPENQIPLDTRIPIGLGTNTALQSGPEVFHPSNDEPLVSYDFKWLKPFNFIAQIPIFLLNQASWFWGWAGFWLWPIMLYWLWKLKIRSFKKLILSLYPVLALHCILFIVVPSSLARYYMITIILGVLLTITMLVETLTETISAN